MIASHLFLVAALTVSGSAPASVVLPLASNAASQAAAVSPRQTMNGFARCLAAARIDMARGVLSLPTASNEQMAAAAAMLNGGDPCGGDGEFELDLRGINLIGGLPAGPLAAQPQTRKVATLASWDDETISRSALRPRNGNEELGLCVVRRAPQEAQRVLETAPDSAAEQQAISAIVPHLGPCTPAGASLRFDRPTIRAQLAIALYRASTFLRTASATGN